MNTGQVSPSAEIEGKWKAVRAQNASATVVAAINIYTFRPDSTATVFEPMFDDTTDHKFETHRDGERIIVKFENDAEIPICITSISENVMRAVFVDGNKIDESDWFEFERCD